MQLVIKVEISITKMGFVECKWSYLNAQGHVPLGVFRL